MLAAGTAVGAPPALTTVADTVYRADGSAAQGAIVITWAAFTTADGKAVAAGTLSLNIGPNGAVNFQLAPNVGATPDGSFYKAVLKLDNGATSTEYWSVPATSPTTISAIRSTVMPASIAIQVASRQYVDSALAAKANNSSVVHVTGSEQVTGTKQFTAPPAVPAPVGGADAANKAYVDSAVTIVGGNTFVSKAGDSMSGPLGLSGDPAAPGHAANRHYVDTQITTVNGAIAQRQRMMTVDVRDYGASCDLSANDTTAVTSALAATPDFGTLLIPPGCKLKVSNLNIFLRQGIHFLGMSGQGSSAAANSAGFYFAGANGGTEITVDRSRGLVFEGLSFNGYTPNISGIDAGTVVSVDEVNSGNMITSDIVFQRSSFYSRVSGKILLSISAVSGSNVEDVRAENSTFIGNGSDCIVIGNSANAKGEIFRHNNFNGCHYGLWAKHGSYGVYDSEFSASTAADIRADGWADPIEIRGNLTENSKQFFAGSNGGTAPARIEDNNLAPAGNADFSKFFVDLGSGKFIFANNQFDANPQLTKPLGNSAGSGANVILQSNVWPTNSYAHYPADRSTLTGLDTFVDLTKDGRVVTGRPKHDFGSSGSGLSAMTSTFSIRRVVGLEVSDDSTHIAGLKGTAAADNSIALGEGELEVTGVPSVDSITVAPVGFSSGDGSTWYFFRVVAKNSGGRALVSGTSAATIGPALDATHYITLTWTKVPGATAYDILGQNQFDSTQYQLLASVGDVNTYNAIASWTGPYSYALPGWNETGGITVRGPVNIANLPSTAAPFLIPAGAPVVINLNADKVDGVNVNTLAGGKCLRSLDGTHISEAGGDCGSPANVPTADSQAGSSWDAKVNAAIASGPSGGAEVDARGLVGNQTCASTVTFSKPVHLILGAGVYTMSGTSNCILINAVAAAGSIIEGAGDQTVLRPSSDGNQSWVIKVQGTLSNGQYLANDVIEGDRIATLVSGGVAALGLSVGDYFLLVDNESDQKQMTNRVMALSGDSITAELPFADTFRVAYGTVAKKLLTPVPGVVIKNLKIDCSNNTNTGTSGIRMDYTVQDTVENVSFNGCPAADPAGNGTALATDTGYQNSYRNLRVYNSGAGGGSAVNIMGQTSAVISNVRLNQQGRPDGFSFNVTRTHLSDFSNVRDDMAGATGRGFKLYRSKYNNLSNITTTGTGNRATGTVMNGFKIETDSSHNHFSDCTVYNTSGTSISLADGSSYNEFDNCHIKYSTYQTVYTYIAPVNTGLTVTFSYTSGSSGTATLSSGTWANLGYSIGDCILFSQSPQNDLNANNSSFCFQINSMSSSAATLNCPVTKTGSCRMVSQTVANITADARQPVNGTKFIGGEIGWPRGTCIIQSIVRASNTVTVTCAQAHTLSNGATLHVAGVTTGAGGTSFNGDFTIATSGPTSTTFTYSQTAANDSSAGGWAGVKTTIASIQADDFLFDGVTFGDDLGFALQGIAFGPVWFANRLKVANSTFAGLPASLDVATNYSNDGMFIGNTFSDGVTIGANGTNNRFINNYGPQPSTCNANDRGSVWYSFAAAGALDSYQACRKDAADAYAWTALF